MKIGVVGCGAVGSYYGARLARAGQDVHFLARSDYDAVRQCGVLIRSAQGDFRAHPKCARTAEEIGVCDLVLIALKTTANGAFAKLLPPLVGAHTAVLTLQNGLGNEEQLAALFGGEKVLGGLCFVCLNRTAPGVIDHIAHGKIVLGEFGRPASQRAQDIAAAIRDSGVPCHVTEDLAAAHWEKLIWNIPFNGLGVAGAAGYEAVEAGAARPGTTLGPCLTSDALLAEPRWEKLVRELMLEVIAAANAQGFKLSTGAVETQITRTRDMGAYKASTLLDFERGQPIELESLFLEPLRCAQRFGAHTPRLEALCALLTKLDCLAASHAAA